MTGRIDLPGNPTDTTDATEHLVGLSGTYGDRLVLVVCTVDQEQGRQWLRPQLAGLDTARPGRP